MADEPTNPTPAPEPEPEPTPAPEPDVPADPEEARTALNSVREEIRSLGEVEKPTAAQITRMDAALAQYKALEAKVSADETRAAKVRAATASATGSAPAYDGAPSQINRQSPFSGGDVRSMQPGELRDRAMRAVEERGEHLDNDQQKAFAALLRRRDPNFDGAQIARRVLLTENDHYRSAFMKHIAGNNALTVEEVRAVNEYRANEGTGSAGGFGVPVFIDPTIIEISGATQIPVVDGATKKTITTNAWKGVTGAPVKWKFGAEGAVVSDNSPTLGQPTITAYRADAFVPFSMELDQDYPDWQGELSKLFRDGWIDKLADVTINGSGSGQPYGLFARMHATTQNPSQISTTTSGLVESANVRAAYNALPERFRMQSTWVMNVQVQDLISQFGNGLELSDFTVNLAADGAAYIKGKPVKTTDYAPAFANTTAAQDILVVGDLSQYYLVQRAGMSVEFIQNLFDPTTGYPNGTRGLVAFARIGGDVVVPNAFRLLKNK